MLKHSPTVFPTTLQLVVAIAVFSVLTRPKTVSCTVPLIRFQSRPSRAPLIPSPIAFPRLFQWKFFAKVSTNPKAVFSPLENVLPTNFQSAASIKPFRKVAMLFAILLQVFWILPHLLSFSQQINAYVYSSIRRCTPFFFPCTLPTGGLPLLLRMPSVLF